MNPELPDTAIARVIAMSFGRRAVDRIIRFPTGLCHHVFDVMFVGGEQVVVRIANQGNERLLSGAVYWQKRLRTAGIPVARILGADLEKRVFPFAYLILDRLAGTDLGEVYPGLSAVSKLQLARQIAGLQQAMTQLPQGAGFGEAMSYDEPGPHHSWAGFVQTYVETCRARVRAGSALAVADISRLAGAASALESSFSGVKALPFLDDITTKNVIVTPEGRLSGIVDTDTVFFGDHLFPLALARAALAKAGYDSIYADAWSDELELTESSRACLSFYTALFAAMILSEHGRQFNREQAVEFDRASITRLRALLDDELERWA